MGIHKNRFLRFSTLALAFAAFFMLSACSDKDEPTFVPDLPANGGNNLKSTSQTGRFRTTFDWKFQYNGLWLTNASAKKIDANASDHFPLQFNSHIDYGNGTVNVRNSTNENIKIVLNKSNYIEYMVIGNTKYNFQYSDGFLTSWQKTIMVNIADKVDYSATIRYENNDIKSINYVGPDKVVVTTNFTPDIHQNLNGLLPETVANEMGCLGFEHLYYAGLLGRPTAHLVKSLSVHHPQNEEMCYTLNFDYSIEGNNTILCTYKTPNGNPIAVKYTY